MSRTKLVLGLALAATLVVTLLPVAASAQTGDEARILVFSKTAAFRHGSIPVGRAAIQQLGADNGFQVDLTEDSSDFNDANLARYDAVVWLSTTGDVLNDEQQAAFERYIRDGGGYVGIHAASDTEYGWPWYGGLVGAYFRNHPANQTADVIVADKQHPSTRHLPTTWTRFDEWYNFQTNPRGQVHVLATLDERSYNPGSGAMGTDHPISWCHAYEGGRSWYTALGHTNESFSEANFLGHVLGGIKWASGLEGGDCGGTDWAHFRKVQLDGNARFPSELQIAEDGTVYYIEMGERRQTNTPAALKKIHPRTGEVTVLDTINVYTGIATGNAQEDGLLGFELDPNFMSNNRVYLGYSVPGNIPCPPTDSGSGNNCGINRVSRFTLTPSGLTNEQVIIEVTVQRTNCCHAAFSLELAPNGDLYISTGDDTDPFQSQGYAPIDERPGRSAYDAQRSAANTNDLRGKILRIRPNPNSPGYTIPPGNLFPPGTPNTRPEIYAMGLRNPFRFEIDPATGMVYGADYGPDAGSPNPNRGPEGRVTWHWYRPGNYGWPYCHGGAAYVDYDFATGQSGETFDCNNLVNDSPNNTGLTNLPPVIQPELYYGRQSYANGGANWPDIGTGGAPMGGPVYRYDPDIESDRKWPRSYDGQVFFGEWGRTSNNMYNFVLDNNGTELADIVPLFHGVFNPWTRPHDMEFGPDGALYLIQWGHSFGTTGVSTIERVDYVGGGPESCLNRDLADTVVIGGNDTGVPNRAVGGGCSVNNLIQDEEAEWRSAGQFVQHVNEVVRRLLDEGLINGRERAALTRAAVESRIGRP
ncbi:MAG TPA: ThuA domain-containing protein [Egibacteraceae bacterium]